MADVFDRLVAQNQAAQSPAATPTAQPQSTPGASISPGDTAGNFGNNLLWSGSRMLGDIGDVINHPVDTVSAAYHTAKGLAGKLLPGAPGPDDTYANSAIDYLKQRYGGMDHIKHTALTDPVGFAADLSTALGGGESAFKLASGLAKTASMARSAEIMGNLGKVMQTAGDAANPMLAGKTALGAAGKVASAAGASPETAQRIAAPLSGMKSAAAENIYQGALKPSAANGADQNAAIVKMGLQNKIPLNGKAAQRGAAVKSGLDQQVASQVAGSNAMVDPAQVTQSANTMRSSLTSAAPQDDMNAFDKIIQQYKDTHSQPYPIQDAQAEKVGTYRNKTQDQYGQQSNAETTAHKALAFGLKNAIEQHLPDIADANKEAGTVAGLQEALEAFTAKEGNRGKVMSYLRPDLASAAIGGAAGGMEHSVPAAIGAHLMVKALEDPGVRSRLAIQLYKSAHDPRAPFLRRITPPATRIDDLQQMVSQHLQPQGNQQQ